MWFLIFLSLPILEIYLILQVSEAIGGWETFWLLLFITSIGFQVIRSQGLAKWAQQQSQMQAGKLPEDGLLKGLMPLIGGFLLVVPGFITDALGILMILPPTRNLFVTVLKKYFANKIQNGSIQFYSTQSFYQNPPEERSTMKDVTPTDESKKLLE